MCDNSTEQDIQRFTEQGGKLNRRQFNQLLALGTLSAVLPQFTVADFCLSQLTLHVFGLPQLTLDFSLLELSTGFSSLELTLACFSLL